MWIQHDKVNVCVIAILAALHDQRLRNRRLCFVWNKKALKPQTLCKSHSPICYCNFCLLQFLWLSARWSLRTRLAFPSTAARNSLLHEWAVSFWFWFGLHDVHSCEYLSLASAISHLGVLCLWDVLNRDRVEEGKMLCHLAVSKE